MSLFYEHLFARCALLSKASPSKFPSLRGEKKSYGRITHHYVIYIEPESLRRTRRPDQRWCYRCWRADHAVPQSTMIQSPAVVSWKSPRVPFAPGQSADSAGSSADSTGCSPADWTGLSADWTGTSADWPPPGRVLHSYRRPDNWRHLRRWRGYNWRHWKGSCGCSWRHWKGYNWRC
jgi:hypothetical protein